MGKVKGIKRVTTKSNSRLEVDLDEFFGRKVPRHEAIRQALGQAIIDSIVERTQKESKDQNNKPFKKYSPTYKKSLDFKAAGKSDKVNLTLTGDMLGLLDIKESKGKKITIGWDEEEESEKAYHHIKGIKLKKGGKAKRDFLGLRPRKDAAKIKEDLGKLIKKFEKAEGVGKKSEAAKILATLESITDEDDNE